VPLIGLAVFIMVAIPGDSTVDFVPDPNQEIIADLALAIAFEPYDIVSTVYRCSKRQCNALDYVGLGLVGLPALGKIDAVTGFSKYFRKADDLGDVARATSRYGDLTHAADYGIDSVRELRAATKGRGVTVHHIIERRFARTLGLNPDDMLGVVLTPAEHQVFTNRWRRAIGYVTDHNLVTTGNASLNDIWRAAQDIYGDYPELLQAVERTLFR
jgi:hypothetical protein